VKTLLDRLSSRTTLFCAAFFAGGHLALYFHRLDGMYVTFMSALMGFVLTHSGQENYFKQKDQNDGTQSNPNVV